MTKRIASTWEQSEGLHLYRSGALAGRRIERATQENCDAAHVVTVLDRSEFGNRGLKALKIYRTLRQAAQHWLEADEGQFFLAHIDAAGGTHWTVVGTTVELLCEALPATLGELVRDRTPVVIGMAVSRALLFLLSEQLLQLFLGELPDKNGFPFTDVAAVSGHGTHVDVDFVRVGRVDDFMRLAQVYFYGTGHERALCGDIASPDHSQIGREAWATSDGSLVVQARLSNGEKLATIVPAGRWWEQSRDDASKPSVAVDADASESWIFGLDDLVERRLRTTLH